MTTLSETNGYYEALETYIAKNLMPQAGSHVQREAMLLGNVVTSEGLAQHVNDSVSPSNERFAQWLLASIDDGDPLPTRFDDKLSYSMAKRLTTAIRRTANEIGFSESGYGGFCCAPTGLVNAQAVPIRHNNPQSKVFIVFESGLFTFIHGIVSTVVAASPDDLLFGDTADDWHAAWQRHLAAADDRFRADCAALAKWAMFFRRYDRSELSYVSLESFGPNGQQLVHNMTMGCEIFITAHEYVHAVSGHQNPDLDAAQVEFDADRGGAAIAGKTLYDAGVNPNYAIAGISLILHAVELEKHEGPHMPADKRIDVVIKHMLPDPRFQSTAAQIAALYATVFRDMLNVAKEAEAAS